MDKIAKYISKKTLLVGDINTGKTARTLEMVHRLVDGGWAGQITVIDLAPDTHGSVGGKMPVSETTALQYLTGPIVPPRLTASNDDQAQKLARANAQLAEDLFLQFTTHPSEILFVNDASLYLQAGHIEHLQAVLDIPATAILNAYYGDSFPDSALTRREKKMVSELIRLCDRVIYTSNLG
jgi:hypothetical protein